MNLGNNTKLGARVLRWVREQGQVLCNDPAAQAQLESLLNELQPIFPELEQVHAWYTYRQQDQPSYLSGHDAETWVDVTLDGCGTLYAIGISVEALGAGKDYAVLLITHELSHVLVDGGNHDIRYHSVLDGLLARYNRATGQNVKNDLFGLQMRFDCRPAPQAWFADVPKVDAPPGRFFHTESL